MGRDVSWNIDMGKTGRTRICRRVGKPEMGAETPAFSSLKEWKDERIRKDTHEFCEVGT